MSEYINHVHIDHYAILSKIGYSYDQEWFWLIKCLKCNDIYLYDRECDVIYFDADNLSMLHSESNPPFTCKVCEYTPNKNDRRFSLEVTFAEAKASSWGWVVKMGD